MSRNLKPKQVDPSWRGWRHAAGSALAIALLAAFATAAMAASPKAGCWGTCGGDRGPVGGFFQVAHNKVESFAASAACLGRGSFGLENEVTKIPTISVRSGKFSYVGKAERFSSTTSGGTYHPLYIALSGQFLTSVKATVSLTIHYKRCGTLHLAIRHVG